MKPISLVAPCLLPWLLACAGRDGALRVEAPATDYTWVMLRAAAEPPGLSKGEQGAAMTGHFENMGRLADEGVLLLAGPLPEPRSDPAHRGIFVFATGSVEQAEKLAASDPAVKAGIFDAHVYPWRSESPMRALPGLYEEEAERLKARDRGGPGWEGRGYVLVSARDGAGALRSLREHGADGLVLFHGFFGGALEGSGMFALDVESVDQLDARLGFALDDESIGWRIHPWYGSTCVAMLPDLAVGAD